MSGITKPVGRRPGKGNPALMIINEHKTDMKVLGLCVVE
jgi:hypothetical protein